MRIRKIVSRLLGAAMATSSTYPTSLSDHHPSPNYQNLAAPAGTEVSLSGVVVCELNQSPWDVYPNLHLFNPDFQLIQDLEPSVISKRKETKLETKEETKKKVILENTGCVLENAGAILENSEHPINPVCQNQKPTRRTLKNKKEKIRKEAIVVVPCKKNDGKKWFCKRPAKPPNSMCEYHLSQSRSYYSTNKLEKEAASEYHAGCESAKRKHKSGGNGASGGASPYYYYNGYGPSTRKRRRVDRIDNGGVRDDIMHLADDDGILDLRDENLDDEECDVEIAGELASDRNEEQRRVLRKRGRKPVKCRSLKSLL